MTTGPEETMQTATTQDRETTTPFGALLRVPVSLWLVVVLMAMSFGAGVIVKTISEPTTSAVTPTTLPTDFSTVAPPLSDDQIAGGLPEGHPDFTEEGGGQNQGGGGQNQGGGGQG
jgi:hypothetical protein